MWTRHISGTFPVSFLPDEHWSAVPSPSGALRIADEDIIHTVVDFLSYLKLKGEFLNGSESISEPFIQVRHQTHPQSSFQSRKTF